MNRHPVILIEGLDGVGKSTLARGLASQLGATLLTSPPDLGSHGMLGPLRSHFDRRPVSMRRAYYRFANLLVSEVAAVANAERPVVIDRYWPSTVAFGVGMDGATDLQAWVGRYPPEVLRPDVMVLLEVDEHTRNRRVTKRAEGTTGEEDDLANAVSKRAAVSRVYRAFEPLVVDTSSLDEVGVLQRVRAELGL